MTAYASSAQIKAALRVTDTTDDSLIGAAGTAATALIDGHVGRTFASFGTVTRYYAAGDGCVLSIDDLAGTAVTILTAPSLDGNFSQAWATSDYQLEPLNGILDGLTWPYTHIRAVASRVWPVSERASVQVTGAFGWASVPPVVEQACIIQASRLFKRLDSPLGVAGFGDMGVMRVSSKLDPDVAQLLAPYVRYRGLA